MRTRRWPWAALTLGFVLAFAVSAINEVRSAFIHQLQIVEELRTEDIII